MIRTFLLQRLNGELFEKITYNTPSPAPGAQQVFNIVAKDPVILEKYSHLLPLQNTNSEISHSSHKIPSSKPRKHKFLFSDFSRIIMLITAVCQEKSLLKQHFSFMFVNSSVSKIIRRHTTDTYCFQK